MKIPFKKKSKWYGGAISYLAISCKDIQERADEFLKDFKKEYETFFSENITEGKIYNESYVKSELKKLSKIARKTKDGIKSYADLVAKSGTAIYKRIKAERFERKPTTYGDCISILRYNTDEPEYTKCAKLYDAVVKDYGEMCQILSNKPSGEKRCFWYAANIITNNERYSINNNYVEAFWVICPRDCEENVIKDRMAEMAIPADS